MVPKSGIEPLTFALRMRVLYLLAISAGNSLYKIKCIYYHIRNCMNILLNNEPISVCEALTIRGLLIHVNIQKILRCRGQ